MLILAIDPGSISGAYAVLDNGQLDEVGDLPVVDKQINAPELASLMRRLGPDVAVVERVSAMPKQGISSTWKFAVSVGIVHGILAALEIPIVLVTPSTWKRKLGLGTDKELSRALAIRKFPSCRELARKKDAGRAEAILLACYHAENGDHR
jgi:Holliday junction resolvasome RuvABC endonuclease subunit